jgi:hypothetical protein
MIVAWQFTNRARPVGNGMSGWEGTSATLRGQHAS